MYGAGTSAYKVWYQKKIFFFSADLRESVGGGEILGETRSSGGERRETTGDGETTQERRSRASSESYPLPRATELELGFPTGVCYLNAAVVVGLAG